MTLRLVLVEMSVMEQRYRAVMDVQAGSTVTDVAERFGVSRQAVSASLACWCAAEGLEGLADRSSRPRSSPGQTPPEVEALICELRRNHPRWVSAASPLQRVVAYQLAVQVYQDPSICSNCGASQEPFPRSPLGPAGK